MTRALVVALGLGLAAAGCADDVDGGVDGGDATDASPDAIDGGPPTCLAPTAAPPWLDGYLASTIAQVVMGPDRANASRRAAARTFLAAELGRLDLATELYDYGEGADVIGRLPATTPSELWILVGAHFDTVSQSPGADDNATGVVSVLATARALADLPCRDHNVMFVLFDQEEIGLVGSTALAGHLFQTGVDLVAAHTIDQVGWDGDGDRRFEIEQPSTGLWTAYQASAAAIGVPVVRTTSGATDHEAFRERGFAAVGVTEEFVSGDTTPHYHRPTDTIATVDLAYTALAVRLVTHVVARELGAP